MKKLFIILFVLVAAVLTLFLGDKKVGTVTSIAPPPENHLDDEMSGPRGEQIFIGSGGGRYYMKEGRKIYVGYKNKKPATT